MKRNNRPEGLRHFLQCMRDQEERCVSVLKPVNLHDFQPVLVKPKKNTFESLLCEYFRMIISSEPQKAVISGIGRMSQWLLFDKVSGGLLGFTYMCDMNLPWEPFDKFIGAPVGGASRGGKPTSMHVQQMKRCLPIWEFGPLTGGKLLALSMVSREAVQAIELAYSFELHLLIIKTLKGRSSQYNRLHQRGILECPELSAPNKAAYYAPLREGWREYIAGERAEPGSYLTPTFQEQVRYWQDRWLVNRMDRTDNGWIRPDPKRYLLSPVFKQKLEALIKKEEEHDDE